MEKGKTELKTPDYIRRAKDNYRAKFDEINAIRIPKGGKKIIADVTGMSLNQYISGLILEDMKKRGYDLAEICKGN